MFFDSHAHYDSGQFNTDREALIGSLAEGGVSLVCNIGCDLTTSVKSVQLAEKYSFFYATVGCHPHDAAKMKDSDIAMFEALCKREKVVAVGEIGLDYHYDNSPRDVQAARFEDQMALAARLGMPVVIHEREAHEDCMRVVRRYAGSVAGVFHCFSGSLEMAKEIVGLGWYIGMTGVVTYPNARKSVEVVEWIPRDRLLIETDCPYLSPVPNRGKRNDSTNLAHTAGRIAEIRGETMEEVAGYTMENAKRLYQMTNDK